MYDASGSKRYMFDDDVKFGLDFRQNKNSEWIPIGRSDKSMLYIEHNVSADGIIKKIEMQYDRPCESFPRFPRCNVFISVQIQFEECLSDSEIPTFRCRILDGKNTLVNIKESDRSRELQLSLIGRRPKDIETPTLTLPDNLKKGTIAKFKVGDVLRLQCIGEIENKDFQSRENFRWCKSATSQFDSEMYEIISFQDDPMSSIVSESKDNCTLIKKSEIFYHVSNDDVSLNITCELGYGNNNKNCGSGRHNSTLSIPTTAEIEHKWKLSPILIHDEDKILDSRKITLEGWGKTFTLLATASVRATNETKVERMQWCVKKENETIWSRVKLQEDAIEAMENLSEKITIFSKMKYHVTVLDRSIEFLVELSSASTCNNGDYFTNISLWIQQKGISSTLVHEDTGTISGNEWKTISFVVIILLVVMFSAIALLLIFTHRRGQVAIFGFIIKKERTGVVNRREVTLSQIQELLKINQRGHRINIMQILHTSPTRLKDKTFIQIRFKLVYQQSCKSNLRRD
uniref:Uncharacterized protein LOC111113125 isoform X4 n=1 Tax=Crassostrea virginica TaxID=6565 RepID=A0A8B8BVD6_CRAVI|nr:uncharacterized protein LOC111113125 isoform X4 [Crassostrea virginica]